MRHSQASNIRIYNALQILILFTFGQHTPPPGPAVRSLQRTFKPDHDSSRFARKTHMADRVADSIKLAMELARAICEHAVAQGRTIQFEKVLQEVTDHIAAHPKLYAFQATLVGTAMFPGLVVGPALSAFGLTSLGPSAGTRCRRSWSSSSRRLHTNEISQVPWPRCSSLHTGVQPASAFCRAPKCRGMASRSLRALSRLVL